MKIFRNKSKSAMITTEVAVSLALIAIVAVVTIGMFNENLREMISSGSFQNLFNGNDSKTAFSAFNRDYSDSQINVQIMGAQGLEMLRQKANNKILDIISESPTPTDSNSVGYLIIAIESIVGQPDVCVYMKKESRKLCTDSKAGICGYNYKVDTSTISSGLISLTKVNTEGTAIQPTIKLTFNTSPSTVSTILASSLKTAESLGASNTGVSFADTFKFIKDLTISSKPYVNADALLMNNYETTKSDYAKLDLVNEKAYLIDLLERLKASLNYAHKTCTKFFWGVDLNYSNQKEELGCSSESFRLENGGDNIENFVGKNESNDFKNWANDRIDDINDYTGTNPADLISIILNNNKIEKMRVIISNDTVTKADNGNTRLKACELLLTEDEGGLGWLNNNLRLNLSLPRCIPGNP